MDIQSFSMMNEEFTAKKDDKLMKIEGQSCKYKSKQEILTMMENIPGTKCTITLRQIVGAIKTMDFSSQDLMAFHTMIKKYDLKIILIFLQWLYGTFITDTPETFLHLFEDAKAKGLSDLAEVASKTNINHLQESSVSQYPLWYMQEILKSRHSSPKIVALVFKKATEENSEAAKAHIHKVLSQKDNSFKASVLDNFFL